MSAPKNGLNLVIDDGHEGGWLSESGRSLEDRVCAACGIVCIRNGIGCNV